MNLFENQPARSPESRGGAFGAQQTLVCIMCALALSLRVDGFYLAGHQRGN